MSTTHSFALLSFIRSNRINAAGEAAIYLRITVDGKATELSCKCAVERQQWNPAKGRVKGNSEKARTINYIIESLELKARQSYHTLQGQHKPITAIAIKNLLLGVEEKQHSVISVFTYHNQQMRAQIGKEYAPNTLKRFNTALKLVQAFMQHHYQVEDFYLSELDYAFITNLEFYFKTVRKCSHNTTAKYITNLRKVINLALKHGWLPKDPFACFKSSLKEVRRNVLTEQDLQALQEKTFAVVRLEQVRDVFLFCCYTGLAYADVYKLSPAQVSRGIDGKYWLFTDRTKTKTAAHVPLLPPALALLDKYGDHPQAVNQGRLFPVSSNQKMNAYLKEIADLCGIDKPLTTHIARHTFATTVTLTNGVPLETVSSMLGHKSIKTTQLYAKVVQQKVSREMDALEKKLFPDASAAEPVAKAE